MAHFRSTELHRAIATLRSGGISFELTDIGGQRGERKRWKRILENVSVVVFVADIFAYEYTTRGNECQLHESRFNFVLRHL
jgi:hypothetical protein